MVHVPIRRPQAPVQATIQSGPPPGLPGTAI
jgi:hypothetical protein